MTAVWYLQYRSIHPFSHSSIYLPIRPSIHPQIHPSFYPYTHPLKHPLTLSQWLTNLPLAHQPTTHSPSHPLTNPSTHSTHPPTHSPTQACTHMRMHLLPHSLTHIILKAIVTYLKSSGTSDCIVNLALSSWHSLFKVATMFVEPGAAPTKWARIDNTLSHSLLFLYSEIRFAWN